jgi:hypothetical protein
MLRCLDGTEEVGAQRLSAAIAELTQLAAAITLLSLCRELRCGCEESVIKATNVSDQALSGFRPYHCLPTKQRQLRVEADLSEARLLKFDHSRRVCERR